MRTFPVATNLNMLHALVLNWVVCQVDNTDIVTRDKCVAGQRNAVS
jgi:hypothetical protein